LGREGGESRLKVRARHGIAVQSGASGCGMAPKRHLPTFGSAVILIAIAIVDSRGQRLGRAVRAGVSHP
jgi:hypothetical protein